MSFETAKYTRKAILYPRFNYLPSLPSKSIFFHLDLKNRLTINLKNIKAISKYFKLIKILF